MKSLQVVTLVVASAMFALEQNGQAQTDTNLVPVSFRAICASTNDSGGLIHERVLNANLLDACAVEHDITNLDSLRLVFNRTNFSIEVVDTNGAALCTSFAFSGGLSFTNTNNTQVVFQRDVYVGTNKTATGVISGAAAWNSTNAADFRLQADLSYIEPAAGTNAAAICHAVVRAGADINNEQEGNEGHQHGGNGNTGNNGNHRGWQNPHNPHSRQ